MGAFSLWLPFLGWLQGVALGISGKLLHSVQGSESLQETIQNPGKTDPVFEEKDG